MSTGLKNQRLLDQINFTSDPFNLSALQDFPLSPEACSHCTIATVNFISQVMGYMVFSVNTHTKFHTTHYLGKGFDANIVNLVLSTWCVCEKLKSVTVRVNVILSTLEKGLGSKEIKLR